MLVLDGVRCLTYEVKLHIGSVRGYHGEKFTKDDLIAKISEFQQKLKKFHEGRPVLSVRVTPTTFVFCDYVEDGWEV